MCLDNSNTVLTLPKTQGSHQLSLTTADQPIDSLLTKEWLLTNGRGSYASSTVVACNTSGYHGLLIGSLTPPTNRIMALANCLEMILCGDELTALSTFEFDTSFAPEGHVYLKRFRKDIGAHFDYDLGHVQLTRSVYLLRDTDTTAVVYNVKSIQQPIELLIRPLVGLRDFHGLQTSSTQLCATWIEDNLIVHHDPPGRCRLLLKCPSADFEKDPQWWFNFFYRKDKERGQHHTEDLWTPGLFRCRIDSPIQIAFWACLDSSTPTPEPQGLLPDIDLDAACDTLRRHQANITSIADKTNDKTLTLLCLAADQFITKRRTPRGSSTTIVAGYPWFTDWGRDTFISLPGLLLHTGRFAQARSVLQTFAEAADVGMIPNCFDDHTNTAQFNSVDAPLWFINAAFQYLITTGDSDFFTHQLLPTIDSIVQSYQSGTLSGIHADHDGLITAGDPHTQLTWMDAKFADTAFTPRFGKPVEVNALWFNCLNWLARFYEQHDGPTAQRFHAWAESVARSFRNLFWNPDLRYLNDCILPDGSPDTTLRPNQIFAVSLPLCPLTPTQQKAVVTAVETHLLTPYGLRTLNTGDGRYHGQYTGPQQERDEAYHQGTIWPYLIGPFVEAYLKVNQFTPQSKATARKMLLPLLNHLTNDAAIGSISEIFEADPPHTPKGCIAQAWSVAELLRAYLLTTS
jgi:predicted glycogen debranching enzyme